MTTTQIVAPPPAETVLVDGTPLPLERVVPDFDPATHRLSGYRDTLADDKVIRTWTVVPLPPSLTADRDEIPADGSEPAIVTYSHPGDGAPAEVTIAANGEDPTVPLVGGVATVEVVAAGPGPIEITAGDLSLTLQAV